MIDKEVKISEMGFMGLEDYYGTVILEEKEYVTVDLGERCPIHGKFVRVPKRTVNLV